MSKKKEITCRMCGNAFVGWSGTLYCPVCRADRKRTAEIVKERTCRTCKTVFMGGPRAWYCPSCREDRRNARKSIDNYKQAHGLTRKIGSQDNCVSCGEKYTVTGGLQKYCPKCAPEEIARVGREQSMDYYVKNSAKINPERNKRREQEKVCGDCGIQISAAGGRDYCEKCRKKRKNKEVKIEDGIYKRECSFIVRIYFEGKQQFIKSTTDYEKAVEIRDFSNRKKKDGTLMKWLYEFKENNRTIK